jgi:hypothetical protein
MHTRIVKIGAPLNKIRKPNHTWSIILEIPYFHITIFKMEKHNLFPMGKKTYNELFWMSQCIFLWVWQVLLHSSPNETLKKRKKSTQFIETLWTNPSTVKELHQNYQYSIYDGLSTSSMLRVPTHLKIYCLWSLYGNYSKLWGMLLQKFMTLKFKKICKKKSSYIFLIPWKISMFCKVYLTT